MTKLCVGNFPTQVVKIVNLIVHTCISGSVNSWAPSMENGFQVAKFLFKVQMASSLVCLVQNGPVLIWVACIGLRGSSKLSLTGVRAFSEVFWTFREGVKKKNH